MEQGGARHVRRALALRELYTPAKLVPISQRGGPFARPALGESPVSVTVRRNYLRSQQHLILLQPRHCTNKSIFQLGWHTNPKGGSRPLPIQNFFTLSFAIPALELGEKVVEGRPAQVVADPRVIASYLGSADEAILRSGSTTRSQSSEEVNQGES